MAAAERAILAVAAYYEAQNALIRRGASGNNDAVEHREATSGAGEGTVIAGRIGERGFPLAGLIESYRLIRNVADLSDSHHDRSIREIRRAARKRGWEYVGDITAASVAEHLDAYKTARRGGKTRNLIRSYLLNFCDWMVKTGVAPRNPVSAVPCARVVKREARFVPTAEMLDRLEAVQKSDRRKKDRWLVCRLARWTGLRRGTIIGKATGRGGEAPWAGLEKRHFFLDDQFPHVRVPAEAQKNGIPVRAEIPMFLADELREHFKTVPGTRAFVIRKIKESHFDRDLAKARLPKRDESGATFTFGSLRHYFNEQLRAAGVPRELRSKALGHSSTRMTDEVYSHPSNMEFRGVIDALAQRPVSGPKTAPIVENRGDAPDRLDSSGRISDSVGASPGSTMQNATTEQTEAKAPARAGGHGLDSQPTGRGPRAGVLASDCSPTQNGPGSGPFTAKIGVGGFEPHTPFCQGSPPTLGQNGDVDSSPYSSLGTGGGVVHPGSPPAGARSGAGELSESNRAAAGISQSSPVAAFSDEGMIAARVIDRHPNRLKVIAALLSALALAAAVALAFTTQEVRSVEFTSSPRVP